MSLNPAASTTALLLDLSVETPVAWLHVATQLLTRGIEIIGAIIIMVGVVRAFVQWLRQYFPGATTPYSTEQIRLGLGRTLGLALEFLLAGDILSTAVAPSWDAIGNLAAIATIRTLLNYFLGRELAHEQQLATALPAPGPTTAADPGPG